MSTSSVVKNSFVRAWIIQNGAAPHHTPEYKGKIRFGDWSQSFGDLTRIEQPSEGQFDVFDIVDTVRGATDFVTFDMEGLLPMGQSALLNLARLGCLFDAQAHIGRCQDPRLYDTNWEKVFVFEDARATQISVSNFGALSSDDRAAVNESISVSAERVYEIVKLNFANVNNVSSNIPVGIAVYGQRECTECEESNLVGCETVFALFNNSSSATAQAEIVFSDDGFATSGSTIISGFAGVPTAIEVVGSYVFVISRDLPDIYYAYIPDILEGTETWETIAGPGDNLYSISSSSPNVAWVGDEAGGIHKVTQLAFAQTWSVGNAAIMDIHAYSDLVVLAIEEATAYYTINGGATFTESDPGSASNLTCCWMVSEDNWLIGDEGGDVWYSTNTGTSWAEKAITVPMSQVNDIRAVTKSVVFMVGVNAAGTAGIAYRSINGGNSWKVLPDTIGNMPTNTTLTGIGLCRAEPNLSYFVGANSTVGLIVKGAGV